MMAHHHHVEPVHHHHVDSHFAGGTRLSPGSEFPLPAFAVGPHTHHHHDVVEDHIHVPATDYYTGGSHVTPAGNAVVVGSAANISMYRDPVSVPVHRRSYTEPHCPYRHHLCRKELSPTEHAVVSRLYPRPKPKRVHHHAHPKGMQLCEQEAAVTKRLYKLKRPHIHDHHVYRPHRAKRLNEFEMNQVLQRLYKYPRREKYKGHVCPRPGPPGSMRPHHALTEQEIIESKEYLNKTYKRFAPRAIDERAAYHSRDPAAALADWEKDLDARCAAMDEREEALLARAHALAHDEAACAEAFECAAPCGCCEDEVCSYCDFEHDFVYEQEYPEPEEEEYVPPPPKPRRKAPLAIAAKPIAPARAPVGMEGVLSRHASSARHAHLPPGGAASAPRWARPLHPAYESVLAADAASVRNARLHEQREIARELAHAY